MSVYTTQAKTVFTNAAQHCSDSLPSVQIAYYFYRYISKNLNIMKNVNIFCHLFQKVKPIYYIDSLHIEWNISSLYFLIFFDDYGLQIMKTQNAVSQKIRMLHKIKKNDIKQKYQISEKYVHFHALLGWSFFCMNYCINVAWHGVDQPVALLRCNEAQDTLIAAFSSSALLGLVSLI